MTTDQTMPQGDTAVLPPPPPAADPPPPPFAEPRRGLRRTTTDRHLGGVAGGLARFLGIDATVVRIALVLVTIFSFGLAISAYVLAWLLVADDVQDEAPAVRWLREHGSDTSAIVTLVVLVAIGVIAISGMAGLVRDGDTSALPVLAGIGLVGYLIATRSTVPDAPAPAPAPAPAERTRHSGVRNTTLLAAAAVGSIGSVLWATGAGNLPGWSVPAAVMAVLAGGIGLSPMTGWSWTLAISTLLILPILVVALIPGAGLRHGVGDRAAMPRTVAEVAPSYRLGVGRQGVDLTEIVLEQGTRIPMRIAVGIGQVDIWVPSDIEVQMTGHISGGALMVDGSDTDVEGTDVDIDRTLPPLDGATDPAVLDLDLDVGLGTVNVYREA